MSELNSAGLEIPDRPVANAMRNGEGLQLIPNTVARLAIIFSRNMICPNCMFSQDQEMLKMASKSYTRRKLVFTLCSLNEMASEHKGQSSDTTGCVNTGLVIGLPAMPGCCQYWKLSSKWQLTNRFSKLHELNALISRLNALVSNDNHWTVMSRYKAQPRWELTAMLGRLGAIGFS